MTDKTRRDKTMTDKTRRDKTRTDKTRRDMRTRTDQPIKRWYLNTEVLNTDGTKTKTAVDSKHDS